MVDVESRQDLRLHEDVQPEIGACMDTGTSQVILAPSSPDEGSLPNPIGIKRNGLDEPTGRGSQNGMNQQTKARFLDTFEPPPASDLQLESQTMMEEASQSIYFMQKLFTSMCKLQEQIKQLRSKLKETEEVHLVAYQEKIETEQKLKRQEQYAQALGEEINMLKERIQDINRELLTGKDPLQAEIVRQKNEIETLGTTIQKQEEKLQGLAWLQTQVDSFHLGGKGVFEEPCQACMLPSGFTVVADAEKGLMLFSNDTQMVKQLQSEDWKWPQGLAYDPAEGRMFVSLFRAEETQVGGKRWDRCIAVFSIDLEFLDYISGPTATGFDASGKESIAYSTKTSELFICITDNAGAGIWKKSLIEGGRWIEVSKRSGVHFSHMQVYPTSGPLVDLVVVEQKMGYVHMLTIKGTEIVNRTSHAPVPKPGAIGVDEEGNTFIHDLGTGKIVQLSPPDFSQRCEFCLIDDAVYSITASNNSLGVAVRKGKRVHVYRYVTGSKRNNRS